jgi:hypothetical protein
MAVGVQAWLLRRDPGLSAIRRAVRVTAVGCVGFYGARYLLHNPVMAIYALFAAVAMGFLSQIPGPARRRSATLLWSAPVAGLLVTVGTLLAGNLWTATAGMLVFGFFIAFAGVGGPRLVGLAAGMQLFFILPCFPPYAPATLGSRIAGVAVGLGLLALAERTLWPDPDPVSYEARLATACDRLATSLATRAGGDGAAAALAATEEAVQAIRPMRMPAAVRPTSAGRRDQALSDAGSMLRFTLARLHGLPPDHQAGIGPLLTASARTAAATAAGLRGGPPPDTDDLAGVFTAERHERGDLAAPDDPAQIRAVTLSLATAYGVWAMATAVRIALGAGVESGLATPRIRRERFPYAYGGPVRLWWRRFTVHLTPRSVYFQGAVRIAVALAAARLIAGVLDLSHGFWVLLATLTLLRSRASDTRIAFRPAVVGTVAGAVAAGILLVTVGARHDIYAAITPPIMLAAFAAGAVIGAALGQALFTLFVTLVFIQLEPAGVALAGVRVLDVLVGGTIGVVAGLLTWPRGAEGEMRRSGARFLAAGGQALRDTAGWLTAPPAPAELRPAWAGGGADGAGPSGLDKPRLDGTDGSAGTGGAGEARGTDGAVPRARAAMALADASFGMYQTERPAPRRSTVDWQLVMTAGHHIVRGSEILRDIYFPGSLAPWRDLINTSAAGVGDACTGLASTLAEGRDPQARPVAVAPAPDPMVEDVQAWFSDTADDLTRVGGDPAGGHPAA